MVSASSAIPVGYKQTELGIIPEDWRIMRFDSVITRKNTKRFQIQTSEYLQSGLHPVVDQGQKYIVGYSNRSDRVFRCPPEGVIVFGDHTCVVKFVDFDFVVGADGTQVLQTFKDFCTRFIAYQLEYNGVAQGGYNRHFKILKEKKFIIPDISEQEAIVNVLSDFDSQMQALENLISKKRDIKQGTMQQLLTAKTRLNGFSLEWKSVLLGDLADIVRGKLITKNQTVPGEVPVIAGGIEPAYFHNVSNREGKTITISGSGANAGYVSFHRNPIFASDCSTINESSNYSIEFIFFMLQHMQDQIYAEQTGGAQPHIYPSNLEPIQICIPVEIVEQEAIAEILSDMDAEIALLEQRLEKTKAIKQGMLQQLLTGRIRLVKIATPTEVSA